MTDAVTSVKAYARTIAETLFPATVYARRIRLWTKDEPELRILPALGRSDRVSIDIGAHQGLYVWHLLAVSKHVVAFEPLPKMLSILQAHYGERISLHGIILSDHEGKGELRFPQDEYGLATVEEANSFSLSKGKALETVSAPMKTLDSFGLKDVGFIKIDVEGHEEAVLNGAMATIRRDRPNVLIEIEERHAPGSLSRVRALFASLDYLGSYLDVSDIKSIETFDQIRDQPMSNMSEHHKTGRYINNFIFLPREKAAAIARAAASYVQQPIGG